MAIPVTTRAGKGSPLTHTEMDTNLTSLARSATESQEGNIEIANQAEVNALNDSVKAVPPAYLGGGINSHFSALGNSNNQEGFYRLPNGLIVQWGQVNITSDVTGQEYTATYPTAFTTAVYNMQHSIFDPTNPGQDDDERNYNVFAKTLNLTSAVFQTTEFHVQAQPSRGTIHWVAIGV